MFDLDGTLINTSLLYFQGVPAVVKRHLGMEITPEDILPMWGQFARNYFTHFAGEAGVRDEAVIDLMYEDFSLFYNKMHGRLAVPYPTS